MSNIIPLHRFPKMLICGCGNETFIVHCSPSRIFTLVCTRCVHGINGYSVIEDKEMKVTNEIWKSAVTDKWNCEITTTRNIKEILPMNEEKEDYELKLIIRAFNSALLMWGVDYLRENPGLLLLEAESIRNMDLFTSTANQKFRAYVPPNAKKNAIKETPNMTDEDQKNIKKCLTQINSAMRDQKKYCQYSGCVVQYFEHYHIDKHTITFLSPEELEKLK